MDISNIRNNNKTKPFMSKTPFPKSKAFACKLIWQTFNIHGIAIFTYMKG